MKRGEQPVTRAVTGEDPAGAVAAVCCRGEADDQDPRFGVTPAGDRPAPVRLPGVRRPLLARHLLAPGDQPRACRADRAACLEHRQRSPSGEPGHAGRRTGDRRHRVAGSDRVLRPARARRHGPAEKGNPLHRLSDGRTDGRPGPPHPRPPPGCRASSPAPRHAGRRPSRSHGCPAAGSCSASSAAIPLCSCRPRSSSASSSAPNSSATLVIHSHSSATTTPASEP